MLFLKSVVGDDGSFLVPVADKPEVFSTTRAFVNIYEIGLSKRAVEKTTQVHYKVYKGKLVEEEEKEYEIGEVLSTPFGFGKRFCVTTKVMKICSQNNTISAIRFHV